MLESQRKKARTARRLMAEGLSKDEARKLARENSKNFRPAFVKGRRRELVEAREMKSITAPDEVSAGSEAQTLD